MSAPSESHDGVVLVTIDDPDQGRAIAQTLIEQQLAACVNLYPIRSIYRWQGKICDEAEWQLVIKTDLRHFAALEAQIRAIHPYDVPEIIALPIIEGAQPYLQWLRAQVKPCPATYSADSAAAESSS